MKRQTARTTTYWSGLLAALAVLVGVARVDAAVIVSSAYHDVVAYDNSSWYVSAATDSTFIPKSTTISASAGETSASTVLTRTPSAFSAYFDHASAVGSNQIYTHGRSEGVDYFTVTAPTPYVVSGTYAMSGIGWIWYYAELYSYSKGSPLFSNYQAGLYTSTTPDKTFTLGLTEGDPSHDNSLSGSLRGTLLPGMYSWWYYVGIWNYSQDERATATGNATLSFVPEPASLVVWSGIGGVGLAGAWLRRKTGRRKRDRSDIGKIG